MTDREMMRQHELVQKELKWLKKLENSPEKLQRAKARRAKQYARTDRVYEALGNFADSDKRVIFTVTAALFLVVPFIVYVLLPLIARFFTFILGPV